MKQLLLRVDDELHAQLTERAQRERRSVNALANEILSRAMSPRQRVLDRTRGLGPVLDDLIDEDRDRRPVG